MTSYDVSERPNKNSCDVVTCEFSAVPEETYFVLDTEFRYIWFCENEYKNKHIAGCPWGVQMKAQ